MQKTYLDRAAEYGRLLIDPNYRNVIYNPENGGLVATHVLHNRKAGESIAEQTVLTTALKKGDVLILGPEPGDKYLVNYPEGTWNGVPFEVKECSVPQNNRNILGGIEHADKKHASLAVLVFSKGGFSAENVGRAIKRYRGTGRVSVKRVLCLQDSEIVGEFDI